jgi:hypothetical protein
VRLSESYATRKAAPMMKLKHEKEFEGHEEVANYVYEHQHVIS